MKRNTTESGNADNVELVTAIGVFPSTAEARRAVDALRAAGYREDHIGVMGPHSPEARKTLWASNDPTYTHWEEGRNWRAAAGGLAGFGLGAAVAAGLMSPLGPVIAGGIVVALLVSRRRRCGGRRCRGGRSSV